MSSMIIKTVELPDWMYDEIATLKADGKVFSKSEFIRFAVWNFLYYCEISQRTFRDPVIPLEHRKMQTYCVPRILLDRIEELVSKGYAETRSSFIRMAIYQELKKWRQMYPMEVIA